MSRRLTVLVASAATLLAGMPASYAEVELPRKDCSKRLSDIEGDGKVYLTGTTEMPTGGKADGLDITGLHLRLTDTELHVLLALKNIPAPAEMPQTESAFRYVVNFKFDTKTFAFEALHSNPAHASIPGIPDAKQYPKANTGGTAADQLPGFTGKVDPDKDYVIWTAPRDRVHLNLAHTLVEGDKFTGLAASTVSHRGLVQNPSDSTSAPADAAVWTVGDDYCFGPPPAKLSGLTVKNVQFGDATTMSAKLVSDTDAPLAGKPVQFAIAGDPAGAQTGTTNADGVATVTFPSKLNASSTPYAVTVTYAGDATDGKAKLTGGTITISSEKTAFNPLKISKTSATARTLTATLVDDDKKAVAGQKVEWLVNGKKVATLTTNSAGQTVYKGAKAGQYVQLRFVAVSGKYLGVMSSRVRV